MNTRRLQNKILLVVGAALLAVFSAIGFIYNIEQEKLIEREHQRSVHKMTSSVINGIESIMTENHAEIMRDYAKRLRSLHETKEFLIMRRDGQEAFRDNVTITAVNKRLGDAAFEMRPRQERVMVMPADDPYLTTAKKGLEVYYNQQDEQGRNLMVFLDPIPNSIQCHRCHGDDHSVRGVIRVVTSLAAVEAEILRTRIQSTLLIGGALLVTMLVTGYMLGRSVVKPIESVTLAMARISAGELDQQVPLRGGREIRAMAESFNSMTAQLREGYNLMSREKDKLASVIRSAGEAMVVTDPSGSIVLVNPSAEELLGKSAQEIREGGFSALLDNPALMDRLANGHGAGGHSEIVPYKGRHLMVTAAIIDTKDGQRIGSAAHIRDVSEERRLLDELKRIAITDVLTGVFNRRHLDETLAKEFARASRYGTALSLLLFDVDHFKKFNDTYGHDQGDRVLQAMGAAMKQTSRQYDVPCRYGGEEFVMILPDTDLEGAVTVGERLRQTVEAMAVDGLSVTISIGAANIPVLTVPGPAAMLEAADAALYRAKEAGRNRLIVATPT